MELPIDSGMPLGLAAAGAASSGAIEGTRQLAAAHEAAGSAESGRLEEAAAAFESLLATVMVKELRRGLSDGFFGSKSGADVFDGWLDEHLGQALAGTGALDVAGFIRVNIENQRLPTGADGVPS
jgi:Rod binding domain-containing protein